jgi:hypothetical protein
MPTVGGSEEQAQPKVVGDLGHERNLAGGEVVGRQEGEGGREGQQRREEMKKHPRRATREPRGSRGGSGRCERPTEQRCDKCEVFRTKENTES